MKKHWGGSVFIISVLLCISALSLGGHMVKSTELVSAAQAAKIEDKGADAEKLRLPIVMYHHVLKERERLNKYTISPDELRRDFDYIRAQGYTPISMSELIAYTGGGTLPDKPIIITFDDGHESFYEYAYPMLREYGYKAVISVVGKYTDEYSKTEDHHISYSHCNWSELKEMCDSGLVEVENHSYNLHVNENGRHGAKKKQGESKGAYRDVLTADVGRLQEECYEYLGEYPSTFTYPFGQISRETLPIIKDRKSVV